MHHPETFVKAEERFFAAYIASKRHFLSYFPTMPFKKIRYPCYNEQYKNTKEYERDNRKDERGYGLPSG